MTCACCGVGCAAAAKGASWLARAEVCLSRLLASLLLEQK